jgi:hypothetical protein
MFRNSNILDSSVMILLSNDKRLFEICYDNLSGEDTTKSKLNRIILKLPFEIESDFFY